MKLSLGSATDAPVWGIYGTFVSHFSNPDLDIEVNNHFQLDCGRHYYPPVFHIEMCSYLSFFNQTPSTYTYPTTPT
jgi:hexosaminidase